MASPIEIRETTAFIDPLHDPRWRDLAAGGGGSLFSSPPWLRGLSKTFGFKIDALIILDETGRPAGGIPTATLTLRGPERQVCLPFSDYCDPIARTDGELTALLDGMIDRNPRLSIRSLGELPSDPRFREDGKALWHAIDLQDEGDHWMQLAGSARRSIRRARESGVEIHAARDRGDLRRFYEMHLGIRKDKYRLFAQPYRFFEALWEEFHEEGNMQLLLATVDGDAIAGVLYLIWNDTLYYKFNASKPSSLGVRPNDLLMWEGMSAARQRGLARVDLGRTDIDHEGLVRYKRKYATVEREITTVTTESEPPSTEDFPFGAITEILTGENVPIDVTEAVGDLIYQYFA